MANHIFSMQNNPFTGDAPYRTWGSNISNGLEQVLTSSNKIVSTINWSTVTVPTANQISGYEVWKLNDPGHASSPPVFMKFTFGGSTLSNGTYNLYITLQCGTGWDGTNLINPSTSTVITNPSNVASTDSSVSESWMSSDGDGFVWFNSVNTAATTTAAKFVVVVDRQRNPNGIAQANAGWPNLGYMFLKSYTTSSNPTSFPHGGATTVINVDPVSNESIAYNSKIPILTRGGQASSLNSAGTKTLVSPMWNVNRQGSYTSKMIVSIPRNDVNAGSVVDIDFLNATRQYRASSQYSNGFDMINGGGSSLALWWGDV